MKLSVQSRLLGGYYTIFCVYICCVCCTGASESGTFYIRHYFGKCLEYDKALLVFKFSSICRTMFRWSSGARLYHVSSGQCADVNSTAEGSYLVLSKRCNTTSTLFQYDEANRVIIHLLSGRCLHPEQGSDEPLPNSSVVLKSGCSEDTNKYYFREQAYYVIQHSGGLCWVRRGTYIKLRSGFQECSRFQYPYDDHRLREVNSGEYVVVSNGYLQLSSEGIPLQPFSMLNGTSVRVNATHCVQPETGSLNPPLHSLLVPAACTDEGQQNFHFFDVKGKLVWTVLFC